MLIGEALRYPLRGERRLDTFAVGGVLGLAVLVLVRVARTLFPTWLALVPLALALVPVVALLGYLGEVAAATATRAETPPPFPGARPLLRQGLRVAAVSAVYVLPPLALVFFTALGAASADAGGVPGFGTSLTVLLGSTVTLLVVLSFSYVYPGALVRAVREERTRSALALRSLRPELFHGAYFVAWMGALMTVLVAWTVLLGFGPSNSIAGVVATFVAFYAHVAAVRLAAEGATRAHEA